MPLQQLHAALAARLCQPTQFRWRGSADEQGARRGAPALLMVAACTQASRGSTPMPGIELASSPGSLDNVSSSCQSGRVCQMFVLWRRTQVD
jgi:hypothetical protein